MVRIILYGEYEHFSSERAAKLQPRMQIPIDVDDNQSPAKIDNLQKNKKQLTLNPVKLV